MTLAELYSKNLVPTSRLTVANIKFINDTIKIDREEILKKIEVIYFYNKYIKFNFYI